MKGTRDRLLLGRKQGLDVCLLLLNSFRYKTSVFINYSLITCRWPVQSRQALSYRVAPAIKRPQRNNFLKCRVLIHHPRSPQKPIFAKSEDDELTLVVGFLLNSWRYLGSAAGQRRATIDISSEVSYSALKGPSAGHLVNTSAASQMPSCRSRCKFWPLC